MGLFLPKLDKTMRIGEFEVTNPKTGRRETIYIISTPQFQRWWQTQSLRLDGAAVGFDQETAAAFYDQAQMQRVIDFCAAISRGLA